MTTKSHLFQKGTSGNPAGRRPGSTTAHTEIKRVISPHISQLTEQTLARALSGDAAASVACLNLFSAALESSRRATSTPK